MAPDTSTERERRIRADIEAQFARKKECERRALAIVHRMLETPAVKEEELKIAANSINPDFYRDIVIERGIANLCGYPLCPNETPTKMTGQKYHVSTLTNTVYDITERVNFCSNHCFKASKYYANQVPTEPLWTREEDEPVSISLLPCEDTVSDGVSGVFGGTEVKINSIPSPSTRKTEKGDGTKKPAAPKGKVDDGLGKPAVKSALDEYRSVVGDAKLDMIKHLLFDKEMELAEKIEEKEKENVKLIQTEGNVNSSHGESNAGTSPDDNQRFPVILERNLEHELSRLEIKGSTSAEITNNVDNDIEKDASAADNDAISSDPFMDHMRIERSITDRLSVTKVRSNEGNLAFHTPSESQEKKQLEDRKRVTFCDSISDSLGETSNLQNSQESNALSETASNSSNASSKNSHDTSQSTTLIKRRDKSKPPPKNQPPVHPLDPIWHVFRAWTTRLTVLHLWSQRLELGEQLERQKLEEKVEHIVNRVERDENSRLDEEETIEKNRQTKSPRKKPVPDFDRLKVEQAMNEEKVVEFFKASFKMPSSVEIVENAGGGGGVKESGTDVRKDRIALPPTDRLSQMTIRRKLVLDRLLVVLPDILSTVELEVDQVLEELKALVETLNLESDTILFRPGQWAVVAGKNVMLLKMASIRNGLIWDRLHRPKSCDILAKALDEIGIRLQDVDNLIALLTDSKSVQIHGENDAERIGVMC